MDFLERRPHCLRTGALLFLAVSMNAPALCDERQNYFDDPFLQATSALPSCAAPLGPLLTQSELREAAHVRAQHGGSCYLSGRCRLPNSYLYDKEIAPRVVQYIRRDGRFDDTSIWVLSQRRVVTLMGCVQSPEQADLLERAVVLVDNVMNVVPQLSVGAFGPRPYPVRDELRR